MKLGASRFEQFDTFCLTLNPRPDSVWGPSWHVRLRDESEPDLRKRVWASLEIFYTRGEAEARYDQLKRDVAVRIARKALRPVDG